MASLNMILVVACAAAAAPLLATAAPHDATETLMLSRSGVEAAEVEATLGYTRESRRLLQRTRSRRRTRNRNRNRNTDNNNDDDNNSDGDGDANEISTFVEEDEANEEVSVPVTEGTESPELSLNTSPSEEDTGDDDGGDSAEEPSEEVVQEPAPQVGLPTVCTTCCWL